MAGLVDAERVADGRAMLERWADVLARVESQYSVDAATVVAVLGVESNFGRNFGSRPLLSSLSTLSCFGRRQAFFRGEFFTTLKIIQEGHVAPERLTGSWAGAFGHTQFMPSTYLRLAVDGDGDGTAHVDLGVYEFAGAITACPADLDGDGAVGASDLAILLGAWGSAGSADLDGSGMVDPADLALLLGAWGACP